MIPSRPEKEYLGDAVYASVTKFGELLLTTEDGGPRATNVIVLDSDVITALEDYLARAREWARTAHARMETGNA